MPGNYLVTGSRGGSVPHVSSSEARNYNAGVVGPGNYVMSGLDASMTTANTLHVSDGVASFQGADVEVPNGGCDLTIQNGSQGMKRNDLVVFRYEVDGDVEGVSLEVIQGTPAASDPQDPAYNEGSISDGTSPVDFPLYRVPLDGITVGTPVKLFETIPTIDSLRDSVSQLPSRVIVGTGVWSAKAGSEKLTLWTKEGFAERFGAAFNNTLDCAVAMNGDMNAQLTAKVLGCWYQNGDVGVFLSGHSTGPIRVNYVFFLH